MKQQFTIWTSIVDFEDWREDLEEEYPDYSEEKLRDIMYDTNNSYLEDERINLNVQMGSPILVIASLGLWNGRHSGYTEIRSGNLRDCLYSDCDDATWYVDKLNDFCCDASHHDGNNHYIYRVYKDNVTETQKDNLKEKLYNGTATRADITRLTKRLGDVIRDIYGFDGYYNNPI